MKYIDAEKLIAEIQRYIKHYEASDRDDFKNGELYICQEILSFITSLQEEQTEIEKEAEINPSMVSNFGPCAFNLSVMLTQEEMEKMNIAPFLTKKVDVIIKDTKQ